MNNRIEHEGGDQPGAPNEELTILDDRYALDFPLTYAASGTAWLASDTFSAGAKQVVVKFLSRLDQADADELVLLRTRFTPAQLQAARALPRIEDLGGFEAEPYIVFARADGEPLDQYLSAADGGAIPVAALLHFIKAVQAMHAAGVLHLDIAPAHLTYDPAAEMVRLLDWGHALPIESGAPTLAPGAEVGIYAGPGMFGEGEPQPRDDVYATACVIYELFSGQHPYDGRTASEAAAMQFTPAPIATLNADQNAVIALALNVTGEQPAIEMSQLIAVFERSERDERGVANAPRALERTPAATPAPRYLSVPVAPAFMPPASAASLRSAPPVAGAPSAPADKASAKPSSPVNMAPASVSAPRGTRSAAPLTEHDALAVRTASIEAMIARDASSRVQPPSGPEPELVEPSIAHELVSPDETMPPRVAAMSADEAVLPTPSVSPALGESAPNAATRESRRDPYFSSASLPPSSRDPLSQPPRTHAPFSRPPQSQAPHSQSPLSQPPFSQPALSQPPLSQPPLVEQTRAAGPTRTAGLRPRSPEADVQQVLRGTEFDRTRPNLLSQPRGWAVSLPLGLTITLASCVIGVVAGMWLAGSGSSGKRADPAAAPAATSPNSSPNASSNTAPTASPAPAAGTAPNPPASGGESRPASVSPAPSASGADVKPAAVALPRSETAVDKPPAETTQTAPSPPSAPQVAPTPKPAPPSAVAAPAPVPAPKPVAPPVAASAKPAAPPIAAAPRPAFAPKPVAPAANVPGAAQAPVGVDLLDATMATRALTERVARETEEELARQRGAKQ